MTLQELADKYRAEVIQPKKDFRDAMWKASQDLAARYKGLPDWELIMNHIRCIEIEICGETFFGSKRPRTSP